MEKGKRAFSVVLISLFHAIFQKNLQKGIKKSSKFNLNRVGTRKKNSYKNHLIDYFVDNGDSFYPASL